MLTIILYHTKVLSVYSICRYFFSLIKFLSIIHFYCHFFMHPLFSTATASYVFNTTFMKLADASIVIALSRGLIFLMGIYLLPTFFGISGVWLSIPFAEAITVLIVLFLLYRRNKRIRQFHSYQ